ncbi:hypothetical protein [Roseomonas fluvialis]|uniref:Uncharacterized protein n=1 Tax=Roseomonas fluvialis TaxID=1750527 RepID=A0ABM7Y5K5_9PROT|nr:hypothetical protein [Roseomonas fluvialis]BDG73236.1 hypothetical protein Rmf_31650 [Roseomonas fluvialis]
MTGGAGADLFIFTGLDGNDVIADFSVAQGDRFLFTGLNGEFGYLGGDAFVAGAGSQARMVGNILQVDIDGNGASNMTVTLTGVGAGELSQTDFIFI